MKRFVYSYVIRDFSVASVLVLTGVPMILAGAMFGAIRWAHSIATGAPASAGTVMLATLPIVIGSQALLTALSYDIAAAPTIPLQRLVGPADRTFEPHG
jgi:uncharacterized membrane protein